MPMSPLRRQRSPSPKSSIFFSDNAQMLLPEIAVADLPQLSVDHALDSLESPESE
jgi:hypothetical protein